ncbi:BTB/POZ domain-containing protein At1g04390 isoform X2 [Tripterygium wilfordii]|uniref:BTB/POZ domain-containing protein At1g04390 isoform X2 n=1 Tax=Tripterygium wilfordii TaxID=458696 RepID=UPI0018F82CFC|nr:BTB/POZ domain-containing protein At1g04390 isoform X2 [Tripterygium wilfordii]XP_038686149.1 BTB/POZ domain-containing protein At1g04390 isoform X2 [Tripterygium wilfordii]
MRPTSASSSKQRGENTRGSVVSGHLRTLHQRLSDALKLGTRNFDGNTWKWQCTDIETQRYVVRSINAVLDCALGDVCVSQHPLIKDLAADMIAALVWILSCKNEALLCTAANAVLKLIRVVPNSILQQYVLELVNPLSSLLSSSQLDVAASSAMALNTILSHLSVRKEEKVWKTLKETKAVFSVINNIKGLSDGAVLNEYFEVMASVLATILQRWPPSRYHVWNDAKLMQDLEAILVKPYISTKVPVLKLYSALALCSSGMKKLLENEAGLLKMIVNCIGSSQPIPVRIEGFKLARRLLADEQGYLRMMSLSCEPIVESIIHEMSRGRQHSGKFANEKMSLLVEACRLALLICWEGKQHIYFWKHGIDRVLLDLLREDFLNGLPQHLLSVEDHISLARDGLKPNSLLALRPYIWDILGWLAIHAKEDFNPNMHGPLIHINLLITSACLAFADSIRKGGYICQGDVADSEPASRAALMMVYSPCKYIASKARFILSEILKPNDIEYLQHLLDTLNYASGDSCGTSNILRTIINLMGLTCYCALPQYQSHVIESDGINTLFTIIRCCLSNYVAVERLSFASHLRYLYSERTCCWVCPEDWEGKDVCLLYGLWGLSELVHCYYVRNSLDVFMGKMNYTKTELVNTLFEICTYTSSHGPRWYAAYILSHFGIYGFPNKLAKRIGKALNGDTYADMQLRLTNGQSVSAHGVVLATQCPSLLPPEESDPNGKTSDVSSARDDANELSGKFQKVVRLSSHVDPESLMKLLEYVYFGYLQAGEEEVMKLKILAKRCKLQPLVRLLCRRRPLCGTLVSSFDLTPALGSSWQSFSDIILEAKAAEQTCWTCSLCSLLVPHVHAHKVILSSGCDYLRALFQSGMQESCSKTIKVPVSWEAMVELVHWFYTDKLPSLTFGCLWDNMHTQGRFYKLQPYVELYQLAEFWCLDAVHDACFRVIISCLDSDGLLSSKVIQFAFNLSLWKLAEVAAKYMAPLYRQLLNSGDLEDLDDALVEMVRAASVQLSHEDVLL